MQIAMALLSAAMFFVLAGVFMGVQLELNGTKLVVDTAADIRWQWIFIGTAVVFFFQLHAHKDASQNKEHRGGKQRHRNLHRFHTFSTSGRPRMPVGITNSTRISSAKETTSLYSVLR
ncbi:DUF3382 domain-containing protein [Klebsiella aerogenes]|uniref:DUF3382 domain-containing protein n=1 Tax=Klebsiella aerogenes TaxID=548 RepID=UPI001D0CF461|nr:DUF3382 domain-containing protein [Klebsiella aerogenes]